MKQSSTWLLVVSSFASAFGLFANDNHSKIELPKIVVNIFNNSKNHGVLIIAHENEYTIPPKSHDNTINHAEILFNYECFARVDLSKKIAIISLDMYFHALAFKCNPHMRLNNTKREFKLAIGDPIIHVPHLLKPINLFLEWDEKARIPQWNFKSSFDSSLKDVQFHPIIQRQERINYL